MVMNHLLKLISFGLPILVGPLSSFGTQYSDESYLDQNKLKSGDILYCINGTTVRAYKLSQNIQSCNINLQNVKNSKRDLVWESSFPLREKSKVKQWESRPLGCKPYFKGVHENLLYIEDCNRDTHIFNPESGKLLKTLLSPKSFGFLSQTVYYKNLMFCARQGAIFGVKRPSKHLKCDALPAIGVLKTVWRKEDLFDISPTWLSPFKDETEQYCFIEKIEIESDLLAAYNCKNEKFLFEPLTGDLLKQTK